MSAAYLDVAAWLSAMVLGLAGALKLGRPSPAAAFLLALRLPSQVALVRALAVVELAAAGGALIVGSWRWAAVAVLYALFGAILLVHRSRTGAREVSCRCLGTLAPTPLVPHAALALVLAGVGTGAAVSNQPALPDVLGNVSVSSAVLLVALLGLSVLLLGGIAASTPVRRRGAQAAGSVPKLGGEGGPPTFQVKTHG